MSIGICVRYRDPAREEEYRPYLTQRHLTGCVWPLATAFGLERVELVEVVCVYRSADELRELLVQFEAVCLRLSDPTTASDRYLDAEHVLTRTSELIQHLRQALAEWTDIEEVSFF